MRGVGRSHLDLSPCKCQIEQSDSMSSDFTHLDTYDNISSSKMAARGAICLCNDTDFYLNGSEIGTPSSIQSDTMLQSSLNEVDFR